jgi:hypothetical protein
MFLGFDSIKKQIPRPKAGLVMTNVLGPAAEYAGLKAAATNSCCDAVCSAGLQPGITLEFGAMCCPEVQRYIFGGLPLGVIPRPSTSRGIYFSNPRMTADSSGLNAALGMTALCVRALCHE